MERNHYLAAELFGYSFANYADHLPVMNRRFTEYMPRDVDILERAVDENWPDAQVAHALDTDVSRVPELRESIRRARAVVDAPHAAASFREGVRQSIEHALAHGLDTSESVEKLVTQICYRAADLGFPLDKEGRGLSEYSEYLRYEPEEWMPDED